MFILGIIKKKTDMTDEQIIACYNETFSEEDHELVEWERTVKGEK